jgi:hypothetical protein
VPLTAETIAILPRWRECESNAVGGSPAETTRRGESEKGFSVEPLGRREHGEAKLDSKNKLYILNRVVGFRRNHGETYGTNLFLIGRRHPSPTFAAYQVIVACWLLLLLLKDCSAVAGMMSQLFRALHALQAVLHTATGQFSGCLSQRTPATGYFSAPPERPHILSRAIGGVVLSTCALTHRDKDI